MWRTAGVGLAVILAGCASTPPAETASGETTIPFIKSSGILDFRYGGEEDLVYIHGSGGQWYQVRTVGPCPRLLTANSLGFQTNGPDQLDRFSTILAEGMRCPVQSITRSEAPPKKQDG
jgi:hypothetical protein